MPKISVIVPVYNVEPYIHRCVDSILEQTFQDFELILINDGSTDKSGKICDEYAKKDNRIHVFHQNNFGQSVARNFGIDWVFQNSDSEWIAFIDSDDWVHKQYLQILYTSATAHNLQIVCCGWIDVNKFTYDKKFSVIKPKVDSPERFFIDFGLNISTPCMAIYKKELFSEIRFPYGKIHEDEYIIHKILYSCKTIGFVNKKLYYYFIRDNSTCHSEKTPKWINDQFEAFLTQLVFFGENEFTNTFNARFRRFKKLFSEYIAEYGKNPKYRFVFEDNYPKAKRIEKIFENIILPNNPQLKRYGFKKWFTGQADELENMKTDIKNISSERGKLFALLWGIKTRFKIYRCFSQLPI